MKGYEARRIKSWVGLLSSSVFIPLIPFCAELGDERNFSSHQGCLGHRRSAAVSSQDSGQVGIESPATQLHPNESPSFPPVFHDWFIETFPEPTAWLASRLAYGRTAAVMSMVGFILGCVI
jgi:serine/threonine-protein kinase ATR